jgi:hypothetical protein
VLLVVGGAATSKKKKKGRTPPTPPIKCVTSSELAGTLDHETSAKKTSS